MSEPCIHCGECVPACPAGLAPQRLLAALLAGQAELATDERLTDCTQCGQCDAVCPSQIALTETFAVARGEQLARSSAHARADAARSRYRSRQARLLRDARERAERDERKRQQATSVDAVAAAIARAKARKQARKDDPAP